MEQNAAETNLQSNEEPHLTSAQHHNDSSPYTSLLNLIVAKYAPQLNPEEDLPETIRLTLIKRLRYLVRLNLGRRTEDSPTQRQDASAQMEWIISQIGEHWAPLIADLQRNVQMRKQSTTSNASDSSPTSDFSSQTTAQLTQTFNLIKQEIQHNILSHFDTFSLQEFHNLLNSLLAYISHKEQQYRRIPRKILERYIERFLPTLDTSGATGSGASFVSFIVNQMRRMKQASETSKTMDVDLFGRLVSAMIRELMGRYVLPVPLVRFLEDQQPSTERPTPPSSDTGHAASEEEMGDTLPPSTLPHSLPPFPTILSRFDKNLIHFKNDTPALRSKAQQIDNLVAYTQDIANLIYLRRESEHTAQQSTAPLISVRPMSEQDTGVHRSSLYSSRYTSMTHGGVGPLEFNLPVYRDPQAKLRELEEAKKTLVHRLEALETMLQCWQSLSDVQKEQASALVSERLNALHHSHKWRTMMRQFHERALSDSDVLELYEETYTESVIRHANIFHRPVNRYADMMQRAATHEFPEFLRAFEHLTESDVRLVQNVDAMYKLAFRDGWLEELREKYGKELKRTSLGAFKERILNGIRGSGERRQSNLTDSVQADPLLQESALYQLMAMIRDDVERPSPTNDMSDEHVLTILHSWIQRGYPNEKRIKSLQELLQQTVRYISEDVPLRFAEVEEYLLRRRVEILGSDIEQQPYDTLFTDLHDTPPPPGIAFGLEFVNALRDMFEESGDLQLIMSPQEAYKTQTAKQLEALALEELDEHLEQLLGKAVTPTTDTAAAAAAPSAHLQSPHHSDYFKALLAKSTQIETNRQHLFNKLKSHVTREEEERLQMQFDLEHASMAIPSRNVITSNHYSWLEDMRAGWAPQSKRSKR